MLKLENIAKQMFLDYARRKTGITPDWRYLNAERKLAWMREVGEIFNMCLDYVHIDVAQPPSRGIPSASYEKGFLAGEAFENKRLQARLDLLKQNLNQQIEDFENDYAANKK